MKTLFGMIITMTFMFAGAAQAGQLMSMEDCRDALYEGGGAHSLGDAAAVCQQRRDAAFVGCVQDRYQDSNQSHTFASATSLCQSRVINYVRVCQDYMSRVTGMDYGVAGTLCQGNNTAALTSCIVEAKKLGFNIGRSVQLCQWTTERPVYLCTGRLIRENGYHQEQALMQCYSEFNRDELNGQGVNFRQVERERQQRFQQQQQEAARRASEQRAQAAQRAADQAAQRREQAEQQQRRQDDARREQNNTYRPPAPPPPVRTQNIPVVDKSQPVQPAQPTKPVVKQEPVKQEPVKQAPVKKPVQAKPVEEKPAKPVKPTEPAKPSAPYQDDESDLPPSIRPEGSADHKPSDKPTTVPTSDCKATNTCDNGVIVDLPNL